MTNFHYYTQSHLPPTVPPDKTKKIDYKWNKSAKSHLFPFTTSSQTHNFDLCHTLEPFPFTHPPASRYSPINATRVGRIRQQLHLMTEMPGNQWWATRFLFHLWGWTLELFFISWAALRWRLSPGCCVDCRTLCRGWKKWEVKRSRPLI